MKRVDNAGNVTCYTYDGLHRETSVTYPSGPNAAGTPNKCFVYDAAIDGNSVTNTKGRLVEAYTTSSACSATKLPTVITDEAFSYTARGEEANFYESTPNSGGYYSVPISYWANGLIETFGPFLAEAQSGYTPDGEGRAGAVGNSVPTITYNAASQPTQLMTSCDKGTCYPITYQYDPNTLRMTGYSAALSSGTISGSLKWNPNGSLQQLTIADPFNSADVQTCSYGDDDLVRIASVNCVNGSTNVWGQTFSYDAFGNLSKSGSSSWLPGYSASTNRYALSGTSYDADGNLLNDSFNKYTWDADGRPLTTVYNEGDGSTLSFVYDAFGHKVEESSNGTYNVSYVTVGKFKLSAHGQTAEYSEFPVPGASILGELGGGTGVKLADWLGTVRAFYSYTGGGYSQSGAHAPFGESYSNNGSSPTDFTGQESDANGNTTYYFPERQYRSTEGRWLSPDPVGLGAVDFSNPQSFNRYAYALNDPLTQVDPQGTFVLGIEWALYMCGFCSFGSAWDEFDVLDEAFTASATWNKTWVEGVSQDLITDPDDPLGDISSQTFILHGGGWTIDYLNQDLFSVLGNESSEDGQPLVPASGGSKKQKTNLMQATCGTAPSGQTTLNGSYLPPDTDYPVQVVIPVPAAPGSHCEGPPNYQCYREPITPRDCGSTYCAPSQVDFIKDNNGYWVPKHPVYPVRTEHTCTPPIKPSNPR